MIIDAQVSTGLASAALAVAITQLLASSPSRPITGHQHAERGAEILANARDILAGPKGAALTSAQLSNYWQLLIGLQSEKKRMLEACNSVIHSFLNIVDARNLTKRSQLLLNDVETASDSAWAAKALVHALEDELLLQRNHALAVCRSSNALSPATDPGPGLTYPPTAYCQV